MNKLKVEQLDNLISQYKSKANDKILLEIFKVLNKDIIKKGKYIYYVKKFKQSERRYFTLYKTKSVDLEDVIQELHLEVIRLIGKYNGSAPFSHYLFATLKYWRPSCVRDYNFLQNLNTIIESQVNQKYENQQFSLDNYLVNDDGQSDFYKDYFFDIKLTKAEKKVLNLLCQSPSLNQTQLAEIFKVTKQRMNYIFKNLRTKLRKYLK